MESKVKDSAKQIGAIYRPVTTSGGKTPRIVIKNGNKIILQRIGFAGTKTIVDLYNKHK